MQWNEAKERVTRLENKNIRTSCTDALGSLTSNAQREAPKQSSTPATGVKSSPPVATVEPTDSDPCHSRRSAILPLGEFVLQGYFSCSKVGETSFRLLPSFSFSFPQRKRKKRKNILKKSPFDLLQTSQILE
jgi:hypothetical protein